MEEDIDQPSAHKTKHDLMMKGEGSRKGSFFKQAKKSYPMFPAPEERIKWDEYGEIIKYVSLITLSFLLDHSSSSHFSWGQTCFFLLSSCTVASFDVPQFDMGDRELVWKVKR